MNSKSPAHSAKALRPELFTAPTTRIQIAKRRSTRMGLKAPVGLSGEDRQKCPFSMPAKATGLNKHGGAVRLNRELIIGSTVILRNQRGVQISARVVAKLQPHQGVPTYGIEFVEQDDKASNFWGITFPSNTN
jgi:hypothetical protein